MKGNWSIGYGALLCLLSLPAAAADRKDTQMLSKTQQFVKAVVEAEQATARQTAPEPPAPLEQLLRHWPLETNADDQWQAADTCRQDPLSTKRNLCGLRWRKTDAFSSARASVDDISSKTKSRFIGKGLADKVKVSGDGVKFEIDW